MKMYRVSWGSLPRFPAEGATSAEVRYQNEIISLDVADDEVELPEDFYTKIPFPKTARDKVYLKLHIGDNAYTVVVFRRY